MHSLRYDRDDKWILKPCVLEVLRSIVEDEVDSGKLLQSLERTAGQKTLANSALKAVEIGSLRNAHFVAMIGFNFAKLFNQLRVGHIEASESAKRLCSLVMFVLLDQKSWGFGQEQQADTYND